MGNQKDRFPKKILGCVGLLYTFYIFEIQQKIENS